MKNLLFTVLLSLLFFSCDSSMLINVELNGGLTNQGYSISDYDFVLAQSINTEMLYFEFVMNKELPQGSVVTFYGQEEKILSTKTLGALDDLNIADADQRSYVYSVAINNFKSGSLIKEVRIGE